MLNLHFAAFFSATMKISSYKCSQLPSKRKQRLEFYSISIFFFRPRVYIPALCEHFEEGGDIFTHQPRTDLRAWKALNWTRGKGKNRAEGREQKKKEEDRCDSHWVFCMHFWIGAGEEKCKKLRSTEKKRAAVCSVWIQINRPVETLATGEQLYVFFTLKYSISATDALIVFLAAFATVKCIFS